MVNVNLDKSVRIVSDSYRRIENELRYVQTVLYARTGKIVERIFTADRQELIDSKELV